MKVDPGMAESPGVGPRNPGRFGVEADAHQNHRRDTWRGLGARLHGEPTAPGILRAATARSDRKGLRTVSPLSRAGIRREQPRVERRG